MQNKLLVKKKYYRQQNVTILSTRFRRKLSPGLGNTPLKKERKKKKKRENNSFASNSSIKKYDLQILKHKRRETHSS